MKRITCEACSSSDLVFQDGFLVCQYCGSRYAVGDAAELGVSEAVQHEREFLIADLMADAAAKFNADRYDEAVSVYDKVLTIDPENIWAISNRGNALGWKTSVYENYVNRSVEGSRAACAIAFEQSGDTIDYYSFCWKHMQRTAQMLNAAADKYRSFYAEACENASDEGGRATAKAKREKEMLGLCDAVVELLEIAMGYSDDYENSDATFWRIMHMLINNCRYYCEWAETPFPERCETLQRTVKDFWDVHYWAEHADEKSELDAQKAEAERAVADLQLQISNDEADAAQSALEAQIAELKSRKDALGLFDFSQRGALRDQIEDLTRTRDRAREDALERMRARKAELEGQLQRIREIDETIARGGYED